MALPQNPVMILWPASFSLPQALRAAGDIRFPLIVSTLSMGPEVTLVSAGEECAFELKRMLKAGDALADENRQGDAEYYVSDRVEDFERIASLFLQEDLRHAARRIDIDRY